MILGTCSTQYRSSNIVQIFKTLSKPVGSSLALFLIRWTSYFFRGAFHVDRLAKQCQTPRRLSESFNSTFFLPSLLLTLSFPSPARTLWKHHSPYQILQREPYHA